MTTTTVDVEALANRMRILEQELAGRALKFVVDADHWRESNEDGCLYIRLKIGEGDGALCVELNEGFPTRWFDNSRSIPLCEGLDERVRQEAYNDALAAFQVTVQVRPVADWRKYLAWRVENEEMTRIDLGRLEIPLTSTIEGIFSSDAVYFNLSDAVSAQELDTWWAEITPLPLT